MRKIVSLLLAMLLAVPLSACADAGGNKPAGATTKPDVADLSNLDAYGQERATNYRYFWKPTARQGYVGDPMPYYENGVYSIFYLQDEGGSLRHSIFRVDTTDFIHYEPKGEVLKSGESASAQDYWIGTGSVVKAGSDYYFFYTGHNPTLSTQGKPNEKVLLAKSEGNMDNFVKIKDFEIAPPSEYSQVDFRDPQAYYNEEKNCFDLTVETNAGGVPLIVKFTVSRDLKTVTHDGIVYQDNVNGFWNLECADITYQNGKYYMVYSGQPEDTVWIASSDKMFSGYGNARRIEGKHFYAAKIVEGDAGTFLVGWVYRRNNCDDRQNLYWGGHLVAHKMIFGADGSVTLTMPDGVEGYFGHEIELAKNEISVTQGNRHTAAAYESFLLRGKFTYSGTNKFGMVLGYGNDRNAYRYVEYNTATGKLGFRIEGRSTYECDMRMDLQPDTEYTFTYIQEGSVGAFYIDGAGVLSFRTYGTNNTQIAFFSDSSALTVREIQQFVRSK